MRNKGNAASKHGEDFAEFHESVNYGQDADLPEMVEQKGPGIASTAVHVSSSRPKTTSPKADNDVARLEAEYATLQDRRQRLLELNRLDEEEQRLKQQIEVRQGQLGH
jgi:hypothetical protein